MWELQQHENELTHQAKYIWAFIYINRGTRGDVVVGGTALQAGRPAGSVPDGVIGVFHSGRTIVLGSTQPHSSNEYQEYFLGVKGGRCVGLRTLPLPGAECLEIGDRQHPGTLWACNSPLLGSPFLCINCFYGGHARTHTHTHTHTNVYVCVYIYIYMHARTHTHTLTHIIQLV
jgi:hypothetical protein